jgi:RNA polymerase I-specific transcription initiation factor RRN7
MTVKVSNAEHVKERFGVTNLAGTEDSLLSRYFPLPEFSEDLTEGNGESESDRHPAPTTVGDGENVLRPGEGYQMFNSRDTCGTLPSDYELIIERGARWVGVSVYILGGVVETYERRLQKWWELEKRRARDREGR